MNKDQIIALAQQYPFDITGSTQALEKASSLAKDLEVDLEGCANHLDANFMTFLNSGDHLDESILAYAI